MATEAEATKGFAGQGICDTCNKPFKPGERYWECDGEPEWNFHMFDEDCIIDDATTAPATNRQSGCSNESTDEGNRQ